MGVVNPLDIPGLFRWSRYAPIKSLGALDPLEANISGFFQSSRVIFC
jgi:hypothetical protein